LDGEYNLPILRYAEVLLNSAEASINLGNPNDAATTINVLRGRAVLPDYSVGLTISDIQHERRIELSFEGHRWNDLKRDGTLQSVMWDLGIDVSDYELLWPVPMKAIMNNVNLYQNPGY